MAAAVLGLVAGAVVGFAALLKLRRRLSAGAVAAAMAVTVVAAGVIWALAPPEFTDLFQERFVEQTVQEQYLSGRTDIWMAALRLFADHPAGGAGLDGFYGLIGVNQAVEYPHNYLLAVAAEGGLAGLALATPRLTVQRNPGATTNDSSPTRLRMDSAISSACGSSTSSATANSSPP